MKIYFVLFISLCLITSPAFATDPNNSDFDSFDSFESCETDIEAARSDNGDNEEDETEAIMGGTCCIITTMCGCATLYYLTSQQSSAPQYKPTPSPAPRRLVPPPTLQMTRIDNNTMIANTTLQDMITNGTLTATDMPDLTEILANMTETKVKEE